MRLWLASKCSWASRLGLSHPSWKLNHQRTLLCFLAVYVSHYQASSASRFAPGRPAASFPAPSQCAPYTCGGMSACGRQAPVWQSYWLLWSSLRAGSNSWGSRQHQPRNQKHYQNQYRLNSTLAQWQWPPSNDLEYQLCSQQTWCRLLRWCWLQSHLNGWCFLRARL